jgi:hypothetical protein
VEWFTVLALLFLCGMLIFRLRRMKGQAPSWVKAMGYGLALLSLLAAGEEISWGQRLFGFETSESMRQLNYQNETNLHNLMPAELFNGLIIFSVGFALVLFPLGWRRLSQTEPWWLPSERLSVLTLTVILINHYRVSALVEKVGLIVLMVLLAWFSFDSLRRKRWDLTGGCLAGWLTAGTLYWCRFLLPAANQQYEIRELLVVLIAIQYCSESLAALAGSRRVPERPQEPST